MHDAENACDTGRLARTVESAEWLRDSVGSSEWACPTCQRLAEVVLPALQMLEARVRALERDVATPTDLTTLNLDTGTAERAAIITALKANHGVIARAAKALGVTERVLRWRVVRYQLEAHCSMKRR